MKELSIEEKAKRYDEALEIAKDLYDFYSGNPAQAQKFIDIFPELKESEDERIRKELIMMVKLSCTDGDDVDKKIAWLEKHGENKPADNVEPKFKVKYAGVEYNVFETKDIAGVTFYGIEDEPNHIDYVKAENCEIVGGYAIKENGSLYPTKPAVFSEQPRAWSEEDERIYSRIYDLIHAAAFANYDVDEEGKECGEYAKIIGWFKDLKDRVGNFDDGYKVGFSAAKHNQWKPSDEQMEVLWTAINCDVFETVESQKLMESLYIDLKELKEN